MHGHSKPVCLIFTALKVVTTKRARLSTPCIFVTGVYDQRVNQGTYAITGGTGSYLGFYGTLTKAFTATTADSFIYAITVSLGRY